MNDLIGSIIAYESGELSAIEIIELFSELVKNGLAWSLQGCYGRMATDLIKAGVLDQHGEVNQDKINGLEISA